MGASILESWHSDVGDRGWYNPSKDGKVAWLTVPSLGGYLEGEHRVEEVVHTVKWLFVRESEAFRFPQLDTLRHSVVFLYPILISVPV